MPGLITHLLCGEKMMELLKTGPIAEIISQHRNVFNLGTQGPDILFYYRAWPWANNLGIDKIGNSMHDKNVSVHFSNMIKFIISQDNRKRNLLAAYLYGYACHYALDLHTHPYIFFRSGFNRPGEAPTSKYTCCHRTFETALDVLMLERELAKKPVDLNLKKLLSINEKGVRIIGEMYQFSLQNAGSVVVNPQQIAQAIRDMVSVQTVLRDRFGVKKRFLSWVEKSLGRYPLMSSMIYPPTVTDGLDYLNLEHKPWSLPWDQSVQYTSTFPGMFARAAQEGKELCQTLFHCLSGTTDPQELLVRIGNRSFSTGIDCNLDVEFRYHNCIFETISP